jgi:aminoglycoside phosphotransferase (APT) family kinase protein
MVSSIRASLHTAALSIVEAICGEPPVDIREETRGVMTFKLIATVASGATYVVRFYPEQRSHIADFEPEILRRARSAGMLVPKVVAESRTGPHAPLAYVAYEMVPGTTLSEAALRITAQQTHDLAASLSQQIALLGEVAVDGYGKLVDGYTAEHRRWLDFVMPSLEAGLERARAGGVLPRSSIRQLEGIVGIAREVEPETRGGLAWGDVSPENILIRDDGSLAGLIDFEGVLSADARLTFGYAYARFYGGDFLAQLLKTSGRESDSGWLRAVRFHAVLRGLRLMRYAGQPLPTGHPRMPLTDFLPGFVPALEALAEALGSDQPED